MKPHKAEAANKKQDCWQSSPLAVWLYSQAIMNQQIDYLHNLPVSGLYRRREQSATTEDEYRFSLPRFVSSRTGMFEPLQAQIFPPLLVFFTNKKHRFSNATIHHASSSLVKNTSDGGN